LAHHALQVLDHLPVQRRRTVPYDAVPREEVGHSVRIIAQQLALEEGATGFDKQ
jgi:hypothetical protein